MPAMSSPGAMRHRRLGRSGLSVSAVAFGTCQLRRVPEQQAIDTLKRGFELGVNMVHTAPDYEGADDLVAQAVEESGREVMIFSQGYGDLAHFEWLFESTCRKFKKRRLEMFGIACVDDRERLGEPVWGPGGVVEFLQRKKAEGRLGATFCTTHGTPEYIARLIASGAFDAIMLAYNALGFHLLSYHPDATRIFEDIPRNGSEIFPLAAHHDVGLMIMKPLAGGLLCESRTFPPRARFSPAPARLTATAVLRDILAHPEVACVVPGTASVAEADENARAGHVPLAVAGTRDAVAAVVDEMKAAVCSRCGICDALCSKRLPVSWLFRDAYITHYPSETFETEDQNRYFRLHPFETAACATCRDVTCSCPHGIDIPTSLVRVHAEMTARRAQGLLPEPAVPLGQAPSARPFDVSVITREIPRALGPGERAACRLYVQNVGRDTWRPPRPRDGVPGVELAVRATGAPARVIAVRHDVEPGTRTHFAFEIEPPASGGTLSLRLVLRAPRRRFRRPAIELARARIAVRSATPAGNAP
jgi:predicted aldo/keto reductase-like oxidoreductase